MRDRVPAFFELARPHPDTPGGPALRQAMSPRDCRRANNFLCSGDQVVYPCVSWMSKSEIPVLWRRLVWGHSLCDRTSKVSPRQQFFCRRIHIGSAAGRLGHCTGTPGAV